MAFGSGGQRSIQLSYGRFVFQRRLIMPLRSDRSRGKGAIEHKSRDSPTRLESETEHHGHEP